MGSLPVTAALTLGLTGPFRRQGADAARGVQLWAQAAGVGLTLADGATAHTGCVAFGLERWTLAFLAQRGLEAAAELCRTSGL